MVTVVWTPSGTIESAQIIENHDGTINVRYEPKEDGRHELQIRCNNQPVQGSPFNLYVDNLGSSAVSASGPGLIHGIAGEAGYFTIDTKGAGPGGLQVAVEGPSKADIVCHDNKDGTVSVTYLPEMPGEYRIVVRFAETHIRGSPFATKITGEGRKRGSHLSIGHSNDPLLKIAEKDVKSLVASVVTPGGTEESCLIKKLPNGALGVAFTPRDIGQHFINVRRGNKHIQNSPFMINVLEREIGDATKVKISGTTLSEGRTHVGNEFTIDTKEAGYGGLSLSVEGPSKADIQCKDNEDGTLKVNYTPTEPGLYVIYLKFADHHVPGSPKTIKVNGHD